MINTLKKNSNSFSVSVEVALFKEEDTWVAYCPALEISSYGDSDEEAKSSFEETINIFLEETSRKGTLERYLLKLGWQLQQKPKIDYKQPSISLKSNNKLLAKSPQIFNEKVSIPVLD